MFFHLILSDVFFFHIVYFRYCLAQPRQPCWVWRAALCGRAMWDSRILLLLIAQLAACHHGVFAFSPAGQAVDVAGTAVGIAQACRGTRAIGICSATKATKAAAHPAGGSAACRNSARLWRLPQLSRGQGGVIALQAASEVVEARSSTRAWMERVQAEVEQLDRRIYKVDYACSTVCFRKRGFLVRNCPRG